MDDKTKIIVRKCTSREDIYTIEAITGARIMFIKNPFPPTTQKTVTVGDFLTWQELDNLISDGKHYVVTVLAP